MGLGAALFLQRQGHTARVVETRTEPATESRALAVNPRTLDILEPTGLVPRMLELGEPVYGIEFRQRQRMIGRVDFAGMHARYPFMLALSQATTERLLEDALEAAGGAVERGLTLTDCRASEDGVDAVLEPVAAGVREPVRCPWLLAADGAHSITRERLGIEFEGSSFADAWHLADVPLHTELSTDRAHAFFLDGGALLFLVRVVDPLLDRPGEPPVWRVLGNRPEPLSRLVAAEQAGPPVWTSSFRIDHRIAASLARGRVYLAGDAAHVHSPVGARGMNLGLEDAWFFSRLAVAGRLDDYDRRRRPADRRVVRQVELLSRVASPESAPFRFLRRFVFPTAIRMPAVRQRMRKTVAGLDHALSALPAEAGS